MIGDRSRAIGVRYDVAEQCGQIEWLAAVLDEKRFLRDLLRQLAHEGRPAPTDEETIGRLRAVLDLLESSTVDVQSVAAVVRGTIRALGGTA
jgi:hypothetical protein